MSGHERPRSGSDDLTITAMAWRLRSTLAEAADVTVHPRSDVLADIRRRSQRRRQAKRAMGTSLGAFVIGIFALALVYGGQNMDGGDRLARDFEPPAMTPGAHGSGAGGYDHAGTTPDGGSGDPRRPGDVSAGECAPAAVRADGSCPPVTAADGTPLTADATTPTSACTGADAPCPPPAAGPTGPGATGPGGASATTRTTQTVPPPPESDGHPAVVLVPTTGAPSTAPPAGAVIDCGVTIPLELDCLTSAFANGRGAVFRATIVQVGRPGTVLQRSFEVKSNQLVVVVDDPAMAAEPDTEKIVRHCSSVVMAEAPEFYAVSGCTQISPPVG